MTLQDRDKRALIFLAVAAPVLVMVYLTTGDEEQPVTAAPANSPAVAERRLERTSHLAAQVPGKEDTLKGIQAELAQREKGLIQADTAPQAQAQLLQILRRVAAAQTPPLEIRPGEIGQAKVFGDDYGEVSMAVAVDCQIEQLVNLLADLTAQPEILVTSEIGKGTTFRFTLPQSLK